MNIKLCRKPMILAINSGGRPQARWPITLFKWTPRWRNRIYTQIWLRQRDRSKKYNMIQFIAVTCLAFSLLTVLIGSSFVAIIAIVQGDPDATTRTIKTACVASRRLARRLLRRKIASCYRTLDAGDAQASTEASGEVRLNQIDQSAPFLPWSGSGVLW